MNIQDRRKTLTVEELRRRYNLDALDKDRKAIKLQKEQLTKVDAELNDFVEITTKNIKELQDQVDGNITTWFFNGVPTVDSEPASSWITDTDKNNHLGDLYYDQDTGYAYRFYLDGTTNEYGWIQVIDSDVAEALAIANAAKDTADSKRRVFVAQPTPPYDIGDIWIKEDTDLYRCRASRSEGSFNIADWIRATNYTDDTVALGTKAELDQFKTQVTENYVSNATLETTVNSITGKVEETYTYVTTVENQVNDITTTTQTATGNNNLYITDSLESNTLEYHIEGKSEQAIRSGKNLLNFSFDSRTINGLTFINKNGVITINGTSTAETSFTLSNVMANTLKAGSYMLSANPTGTVSGSYSLPLFDSSGYRWGWSNGDTKLVTLTKDIDSYHLYFYCVAGITFTNYIIKPQLESGTVKTDWEQYGVSPSPNYPSEIKTIPSIRNLFNEDIIPENYYYDASGNKVSYGTACINQKIDTVKKQYIISYSNKVGNSSYIRLCEFKNDGTFIKRTTINTSDYTITLDDNTSYIIISVDMSIGLYFEKLMIEEGSIAHDYVPYGAWAKVKITGKNIFNKDKAIKGYYYHSDGTKGNSSNWCIKDVKVKPNTTYIISGNKYNNEVASFIELDSNKNFIKIIGNYKYDKPFTTTDNTFYVGLSIANYSDGSDLNTIQLEEEKATEYEAYKEKEVLIDLQGNDLSSIGDLKDTLDIVNGQVVINKKIGKVVLDGTEAINRTTTYDTYYRYNIHTSQANIKLPSSNSSLPIIVSNYFNKCTPNQTWGGNTYDNNLIGISLSPTLSSTTGGAVFFVKYESDKTSTLDKFKNWLSENPVTVYYELEEPEQITLNSVTIPLFEDFNNVMLVDELETTTIIKFLRETPLSNDYATNQQLDITNSNLANTTNQTNQNASDINATNTNLNNNYYNKEQIDVMNTSTQEIVTQIKNTVETNTTATNLQISILQEQLTNGVTQVITETGYRFDKDGLFISKTGSEMSSLLDNDGLVVKRNETEVLTVRSSGVETENLKVRTYFTIGSNTRVENYKNGTGFFFVGGEE